MNERSTQKRLGPAVAEEVRALLARRRISGVQFAKQIGKSQPYFSRRLNGDVAFDLDDLEAIAKALDIEVGDLFPHREGRSSQDFEHAPADSAATIGHLSVPLTRRVTRAAPRRPIGPSKPGPNRPVSAVPARKRRPQPVRPASEPARV
jgi:transcriptional regulator with XRE-family HTH domain